MITNELNSVAEFHNAFSIAMTDKPTIDLPLDIIKLRFNLMKEENEEYLEAAENNEHD